MGIWSLSLVLVANGVGAFGGTPATIIRFPTLGARAEGEAVLLAVDSHSLAIKSNLCFYLSKPKVRKEPVLTPRVDDPKAPDSIGVQGYGTVLFDDGRFRLWYYALHYGSDRRDIKQGPVCYAESDDGLHWLRPNLGQLEVKGSDENNALRLADTKTQGPFVIKDPDEANPQRRYKMVYNAHNGSTWVFRTATSPDGLTWACSPDFAVREFLEISSFYKHNGIYVVSGQGLERSEGGALSGRQGYVRISPDFDRWLDEAIEAFALPEPADPAERGHRKPYDQVHLGVGGKSLGNATVGLYGLWHNADGDPSVTATACDLGLVVSNDGIHYREPVKGHVFLSRFDSVPPPIEGKHYPTALCQSGNSIINVGDETRIYHGRWRNTPSAVDYYVELGLATLPRDRWGALGLYPDRSSGSVWSAPVRLPETDWSLSLNADVSGDMRVEIADPAFGLLAEYCGANAGRTQTEGGLDCPVSWAKGSLRMLQGKTVRFRVQIARSGNSEPRLYAVYIRAKERRSDVRDSF